MPKKIFISQPMSGLDRNEVWKFRQTAISRLQKFYPEATFIDSWIEREDLPEDLEGDAQGCWCLGRSIEWLAEADLAVFLSGWENSRGCLIERRVAEDYHIDCLDF